MEIQRDIVGIQWNILFKKKWCNTMEYRGTYDQQYTNKYVYIYVYIYIDIQWILAIAQVCMYECMYTCGTHPNFYICAMVKLGGIFGVIHPKTWESPNLSWVDDHPYGLMTIPQYYGKNHLRGLTLIWFSTQWDLRSWGVLWQLMN